MAIGKINKNAPKDKAKPAGSPKAAEVATPNAPPTSIGIQTIDITIPIIIPTKNRHK